MFPTKIRQEEAMIRMRKVAVEDSDYIEISRVRSGLGLPSFPCPSWIRTRRLLSYACSERAGPKNRAQAQAPDCFVVSRHHPKPITAVAALTIAPPHPLSWTTDLQSLTAKSLLKEATKYVGLEPRSKTVKKYQRI
ncbi:hypothetical protein ACLB2K_059759 [Fragaria x ananassa]